jgi:putative endonuclease
LSIIAQQYFFVYFRLKVIFWYNLNNFMYYQYILKCADKTLYAGITVDLARRVREHNASRLGAKYTRARRPVKLVYFKKYRTRSAAAKAEWKIKALNRVKKLKLIKKTI